MLFSAYQTGSFRSPKMGHFPFPSRARARARARRQNRFCSRNALYAAMYGFPQDDPFWVTFWTPNHRKSPYVLVQKVTQNGWFRVSRGPGTKVEKRVKFSSRMSGSKWRPPSDSYCSGLFPLFGTRVLGVIPDFIGLTTSYEHPIRGRGSNLV